MKRFALTKKYKKTNLLVNNINKTDTQLRITSSIERISNQSDVINKTLFDVSKSSNYELHKTINLVIEEIINLFYDMELAILSEGAVPLIMGEKLQALKSIVSLCKIQLCLPEINEISFPKLFIEEYSLLLERTNKAMSVLKARIDKLKIIEGSDSLRSVLEKNLFTLNMLKMHYVSALGLPEMN